MHPLVPLLWLCGPSGVGKSTVGWEIFSRLAHTAFVDADQLGLCYPLSADDPYNHGIKARNLGAIWPAFRAAGAESVILAGGIEVAEQAAREAEQLQRDQIGDLTVDTDDRPVEEIAQLIAAKTLAKL